MATADTALILEMQHVVKKHGEDKLAADAITVSDALVAQLKSLGYENGSEVATQLIMIVGVTLLGLEPVMQVAIIARIMEDTIRENGADPKVRSYQAERIADLLMRRR